MPAVTLVIDPNRDPKTGRFAPRWARWGITTIRLPNGKVGYRLGGKGHIFASRDSAARRALAVRPSIVHTGPIRNLVVPIGPRPAFAGRTTRPARSFAEGIEAELKPAPTVNSFDWAMAVRCYWDFATEKQRDRARMILNDDWAASQSYAMAPPEGPTVEEMIAAKRARATA